MQFSRCLCDEDLYVRIPRSLWMRAVLPGRRLYYCPLCNRKMLMRPVVKRRAEVPAPQPTREE